MTKEYVTSKYHFLSAFMIEYFFLFSVRVGFLSRNIFLTAQIDEIKPDYVGFQTKIYVNPFCGIDF